MKKITSIFIMISVLLSSCAVTKGLENDKVKKAMDLQESVVNDPLFAKILRELEASGDIKWPKGGMKYVKEDLSNFSNKTEWLIEKYNKDGVYDNESVFLWRKWNPFSKTVAVTTACVNKTKLNKWKLGKKRTVHSILNTLVHERVHSYCYIHPESQKKEDNECDPSYITGYLAEAILLYRNGGEKMTKDVCPALKNKIEEYNLNVRN
tara:strand:- start:5874 stop:6497 length:624 start_codon:yes stop_codon:yes gene_type:complete